MNQYSQYIVDNMGYPQILATFVGLIGAIFIVRAIRRLVAPLASYKGKIVIITGASSGIGKELALNYASLGATVVLVARRVELLQSVAKTCKELMKKAGSTHEPLVVRTDVSIQEECNALVQTVIKKYQKIDILVLNAGQGCLIRVAEVGDDIKPLRNTMEVNFWGYVYATLAALDHLRKARGKIVIISSLAAKFPTPLRSLYGATKAAVNAYFDVLRVEEPLIQVTNVCPGFVLSEIHDRAYTKGKLERQTKEFMTAEEAAHIIIEAEYYGKREVVMTFWGKVGVYLRILAPGLVDLLAKRVAQKSVKKEQ